MEEFDDDFSNIRVHIRSKQRRANSYITIIEKEILLQRYDKR